MLIAVLPLLLIVGGVVLPVRAVETLAKFEGGIGVIPVSGGQGTDATATTVIRNITRRLNWPGLGHRRSGGPGDHGRGASGEREGLVLRVAIMSGGRLDSACLPR